MAAVKYADLQNNRLTNYSFSYDRMLDMKVIRQVFLRTSAFKTEWLLACTGKHRSVFTLYTHTSFVNFMSRRRQGFKILHRLAESKSNFPTLV